MPGKARGLEGQAPRPCLNMRVSPQLRAQLEAAALASGRSIATEAEMRLELSFAAQTPSLTAEDVRQIVREEMVRPGASYAPVPGLSDRMATSGAHHFGQVNLCGVCHGATSQWCGNALCPQAGYRHF